MNANLAEPEGDCREEYIAATIMTEGIEEMSAQFLPRRRPLFWDWRTWSMLQKGREVRSRTDYILGTDRHRFGNVSVRYPRNNSENCMVLGCLPIASLPEHKHYLGGRKKLPLQPPPEPTNEDKIFAAL